MPLLISTPFTKLLRKLPRRKKIQPYFAVTIYKSDHRGVSLYQPYRRDKRKFQRMMSMRDINMAWWGHVRPIHSTFTNNFVSKMVVEKLAPPSGGSKITWKKNKRGNMVATCLGWAKIKISTDIIHFSPTTPAIHQTFTFRDNTKMVPK